MRLLYGNDKRHPRRTLNLAELLPDGHIFLQEGGFKPDYGDPSIVWAGRSLYREGEDRLASSPANANLSITCNLRGGSMTELGRLVREINRFLTEITLRREKSEPVEKVWLEYRWLDRLDLPAPFFGQWAYYFEVLNISPKMPADLHSVRLVAGDIEAVVLDLICSPYPEGLPQPAGVATGCVMETPLGTQITNGGTNRAINGNFGHPTNWSYGWTATNSAVTMSEETGYWLSGGRAARIANSHATTAHGIAQTASSPRWFSYMCRRPDGGAVTTADTVVYTNLGTSSPTIRQVPGTDWYYCYTAGVSSSATAIGPAAQPGREIIVDNVTWGNSTAVTPFFSGDLPGCLWNGPAFQSAATVSQGQIVYEDVTGFGGQFTFGGWVTPAAFSPGNNYIFNYSANGNNALDLQLSSGLLILQRQYAGALYSGSWAVTLTPYTPLHLMIVQGEGTLILYVNGTVRITLSTGPGQPGPGSLTMPHYSAQGVGFVYDGWRGFDAPLTAAEIGLLYANELPVKQAGGKLGSLPFLWTKDGDGVLDNYSDGSAHENWGVLAGVGGDVPAKVEWRITPPNGAGPGTYWLGRKAIPQDAPERFTPYNTIHVNRSGTALANTTGGQYNKVDCTTAYSATGLLASAAQPRFLRGRWRWMVGGRLVISAGYLRPCYRLGGTAAARTGTETAVAVASALALLPCDNWDMLIDWPAALGDNPGRIDWGFEVKGVNANADLWTDWYQLFPYPFFRASLGAALTTSGGAIVVYGTEAYKEDAASTKVDYELTHEGDDVTAIPGFDNFIFLMIGGGESPDLTAFDITDTATVQAVITPRWLIAGGPVA
jgi:hypothetical protein